MSDASEDKAETKKTTGKPEATIRVTPPQGGKSSSSQTPQLMTCGAAIEAGQMERFVKSFQQSTQRWEVIVYPALFAFILLATYGFFLIYNLTGNMSAIARSMDPNMGEHMQVMADNMKELTLQIQSMTKTVEAISVKLDTLPIMVNHIEKMDTAIRNMDNSMLTMDKSINNMDKSMSTMNKSITSIDNTILVMHEISKKLDSLPPMLEQMVKMDKSIKKIEEAIQYMTANIDHIRVDLMSMSQSVARPMSFFNSFAPW